MNSIRLKGIIKNIQYSHNVGGVEYDKADIVVKRRDGKEDILILKFNKALKKCEEGQEIELLGNVRTFSQQVSDTKNSVSVYVSTCFESPNKPSQRNNDFSIFGRICKMNELRETTNGNKKIHFILANNMITANPVRKLNSYLPCIAWGSVAEDISKLKVSDEICIKGELHSRDYVKVMPDGKEESHTAHELVVSKVEREFYDRQ